MIIQQNQNKTLIFLANILCVHVRKSDEMYASPTWCTHAKKKKTRLKWPRPVFDFTQRSLHRAWPPMCSPLFLPKKSSHKFAVVFCKRYACFGGGGGRYGARSLRIENHASRAFRVRLCDLRLRGFRPRSSATLVQVLLRVQRQTSGRRTRGRTLSCGRAADCEWRLLLENELANFVMWISRPCSPVRKWQLDLPKRAFSSQKVSF